MQSIVAILQLHTSSPLLFVIAHAMASLVEMNVSNGGLDLVLSAHLDSLAISPQTKWAIIPALLGMAKFREVHAQARRCVLICSYFFCLCIFINYLSSSVAQPQATIEPPGSSSHFSVVSATLETVKPSLKWSFRCSLRCGFKGWLQAHEVARSWTQREALKCLWRHFDTSGGIWLHVLHTSMSNKLIFFFFFFFFFYLITHHFPWTTTLVPLLHFPFTTKCPPLTLENKMSKKLRRQEHLKKTLTQMVWVRSPKQKRIRNGVSHTSRPYCCQSVTAMALLMTSKLGMMKLGERLSKSGQIQIFASYWHTEAGGTQRLHGPSLLPLRMTLSSNKVYSPALVQMCRLWKAVGSPRLTTTMPSHLLYSVNMRLSWCVQAGNWAQGEGCLGEKGQKLDTNVSIYLLFEFTVNI